MSGRTGCTEMSLINSHYLLHNNPEERSSHLFRSRGLKSRNFSGSQYFRRFQWARSSITVPTIARHLSLLQSPFPP
jgi:hypothetical protein